MKYLLTIAFAFMIFTGNVKAAPLHAYYCFNALETANNVVNAFDGFLNSPASDGMSTHRLYAFPLNGENEITHCMVGEHSGLVHQPAALVGPPYSSLVQDSFTLRCW